MAWLTGWNYRKAITIDYSKIDEDLTDFPILVKLTSGNFDFSKAQANGNDLRFTSDDGSTLLKYERERHDSANSKAEYWVKVPSISSSSDTVIYVYYKNDTATDGADPTNVWDANFKGVWHLNQDPSGTAPQELDSTANNNDGTADGSMTSDDLVEGQVDGALNFDGTDDDVNLGFSTNYTDAVTLECIIKKNVDVVSGDKAHVFNKNSYYASSATDFPICILILDTQKVSFRLSKGDDYSYDLSLESTTVIDNSSFYYISGTYVANGTSHLFINGSEEANGSSNFTISSNNRNWTIGRAAYLNGEGAGHELLNGEFDETRISSVARSASWIKASYNSENNSLVTFGAEESPGGINFLDGKIRIKNAAVNIFDSKAEIKDTTTKLLDGKIYIGLFNTNFCDGKVLIKDTTSEYLDGKVDIKGENTALLDGKVDVYKVASQVFDGKAKVKDSISNLLDGKANVTGYAIDSLDGKLEARKHTTNLFDGKVDVNKSTIGFFDSKVFVKSDITDALDGNTVIKDSTVNIYNGKIKLESPSTNVLDGKIILYPLINGELVCPLFNVEGLSSPNAFLDESFSVFNVEAFTGGITNLTFPFFNLDGIAKVGEVLSANLNLPSFTLEALTGINGLATFPFLECNGDALVGNLVNSNIGLPLIKLNTRALVSVISTLEASLPNFQIDAEGLGGILTTGNACLDPFHLVAKSQVGSLANAVISLPCIIIDGDAAHQITGIINVEFPMLSLEAKAASLIKGCKIIRYKRWR